MRYIRFLKTPRIVEEKKPSRSHISCLITITSDLGDSFLPYDITLSAELSGTSGQVIVWKSVQWTSGMRSLPITLPLSRSQPTWPVKIRVGVVPKSSSDEYEKLSHQGFRGVVSAWSAPFDPAKGVKEAVKMVERRFGGSSGCELSIWEETGESIARHLWDAGITLSCHLNGLVDMPNKSDPLVKVLYSPKGKKRLQVLELGTGCGMVGICIAQGIENADVVLTDLPEAEEIVHRNLSKATLAKDSTIRFQKLDWEVELPEGLNDWSKCPHCTQLDLIVAADCTYNPDSSLALITTMSRLARTSPNVVVVVAMKMRHSSEEVFFSLMSQASFRKTSTTPFPLPGDERRGEETVYVHSYRYEARDHGINAIPNEACHSR